MLLPCIPQIVFTDTSKGVLFTPPTAGNLIHPSQQHAQTHATLRETCFQAPLQLAACIAKHIAWVRQRCYLLASENSTDAEGPHGVMGIGDLHQC